MALSAVVVSGAAAGAVVEGFKSAKNTMQKILKKDEVVAADDVLTESTGEVMAEESQNSNVTKQSIGIMYL